MGEKRDRKKSKSSDEKRKSKKKHKREERSSKEEINAVKEESRSTECKSPKETTTHVVNDPLKQPSVADFFSQLQAQESKKQSIGTMHTKSGPSSTEVAEVNREWECIKAGCGIVNDGRNIQCIKCKAMRRMNEWR